MEKAEIRSEIQPAELERPVKSGSSKKRKRKKYLFVYLMLVPAIINFAIFYVGVNLNSFIMAFRQPVEMGENGFIYQFSLINFRKIFTALTTPLDELHVGFFNTLKYFASALLITLPLSYLTSYFLYKKMWGYKFFRIVFFLPSIIPAIVYVTVFQNMLNVSGPVGVLYQAIFGEQIPPLLTTASTATNCIIFFTIWTGFGVNMLLYQGAMSRLPEEVLEAGNRFTVEFDTDMVDTAVAGGTGMTKFTNLNVASGVDSLGEYYIANPFINDISEYSALAIRVYNPNNHAISFGYNTSGATHKSYTVEAESYATIVFSVDYILKFAEKVQPGTDGDITDLVLMIYNVPKGESFYLGAAFALRYEDLEAATMETSGSVSAGSAYSVDGIRPVVVKESCKYEWARGEQVHGVGYVLTSVKNGSEDVEFTFDQKTGAASFTPAATGNYTLGYTAKLWKEDEAVVDGTFDWGGAETLTLDVNVTVA